MKRIINVVLVVIIFLVGCNIQEGEQQHMPRPHDVTMNEDMRLSNQEEFLPHSTEQQAESTSILNLKDGDEIIITAQIIEKEINGKTYTMYGYNGQIPGPFFKVQKGSTIAVNFHNEIDQPTTIHWHGLRHDIKDDGVPGISQKEVQPGESFTYTVSFPDTGIFWYHPHVREDLQQDLGLYGNMLVQETNYFNPVNKEEVLILDDILIDEHGLVPFGKDHATHALMGRFGNVMLVNGETNYKLKSKKSEVVRFYITNVANARPFNLVIPGAKLKLVGSDIGKYEKETFVEEITLAPAERYILEVYFEHEGDYKIQNKNPEKTYDLVTINVNDQTAVPDYANAFTSLKQNQDVMQDIDEFRTYFDKPIDYELELTMQMDMMMQDMVHPGGGDKEDKMTQHLMKPDVDSGMNNMMDTMPCHQMPNGEMMGNCENNNQDNNHMMQNMNHLSSNPIEWEDDMGMMNTMSTSKNTHWILKDKATGKENMDIKYTAKVGDKIKVRLFNNPKSMHPMQHPIHLHGQRFLVLNVDGKPNDNLVWKDTVLVPTGSTVDILVDVTNPGEWMIHCHIAEHLTAGMMTSFIVEE